MNYKHSISILTIILIATSPTSILFAQSIPGDITHDNKVDSLDIKRGIDIILNRGSVATEAEFQSGDLNLDRLIDVADIRLIANLIHSVNLPPVADAGASDSTGLVGANVSLDGSGSVDFDNDSLIFKWRQLHGGRDTRKYMTANHALLPDSNSVNPDFTPQWPGNYVFELTVFDQDSLSNKDTIDVLVSMEGARKLDAKLVTFTDFYGDFDYHLDVTPDNPDSMIAVFDQALDAISRMGGEWASIVNTAAYFDINPLPEIRFYGDPFSLNDDQLELLVNRAKSKGIKFCLQEQVYPYTWLTPQSEIDSLHLTHSTQWWETWFDEYEAFIVGQAQVAERLQIDMMQILLYAEFTFRADQYPQVDQRWRTIINEIRAVYSGKIGLSTYTNPFLSNTFTFIDEFDVYMPSIATLGGGFPMSPFSTPENPSLAELKTKFTEYFENLENMIQNKVPVYVFITVASWNRQNDFTYTEPIPASERDFQEQVNYYEAFFQTILDRPQVQGVFIERICWFEPLVYSPYFEYFNQSSTASVRNKPAEKVVKLWFDIFQ